MRRAWGAATHRGIEPRHPVGRRLGGHTPTELGIDRTHDDEGCPLGHPREYPLLPEDHALRFLGIPYHCHHDVRRCSDLPGGGNLNEPQRLQLFDSVPAYMRPADHPITLTEQAGSHGLADVAQPNKPDGLSGDRWLQMLLLMHGCTPNVHVIFYMPASCLPLVPNARGEPLSEAGA